MQLKIGMNPNRSKNKLTIGKIYLEDLGYSLKQLHMEPKRYLPRGGKARNMLKNGKINL